MENKNLFSSDFIQTQCLWEIKVTTFFVTEKQRIILWQNVIQ